MSVVVVGVDGSEGGKAALQFAVEEARLRHATLRAVHAWQLGYIGASTFEGTMPAVLGGELDELRRGLEASLGSMLAGVAADGVQIERRLVEGTPAGVLVDESRDADMVVVGSRGHGGFAELLLGSVGHQVAHHAECPVVIVRPKKGKQ